VPAQQRGGGNATGQRKGARVNRTIRVQTATSAYLIRGNETGSTSAVHVPDTDAADRIAVKAALRDEFERIAAMSILPSIRKSSLLSPDSVRTGMEFPRATNHKNLAPQASSFNEGIEPLVYAKSSPMRMYSSDNDSIMDEVERFIRK
jgi:hypothetical protein